MSARCPDWCLLFYVRLAQPSCYVLLQSYANVVPRPGYTPNGEDRAWGRRLARRFACEGRYDEKTKKLVKENVYNAVYPSVKKEGNMRLYQQ